MIGSQFAKKDIEGDSASALLREFRNHTAIDLAGPDQPKAIAKRPIPNARYALLVDINKAQIRGCRGREVEGLPGAHVERHALEALDKIQIQAPHEAHQCDHPKSNQNRNALERLELHSYKKNKKTRAT